MRLLRVGIALASLALAACSASHSVARAQGDIGPAASASSMDGDRDIVLAVANPLEPPATHAGSTLIGYTPPASYGAGQRALAVLSDIEKQYGLRERTGWPIKALSVYCVVVETPPGVSRDALLKTLAADQRVSLAQPLQDYTVYSDSTASASQGNPRYNDPYVDLQRGFVETDAQKAHQVSQGHGVHVAVIDTGVDPAHPDLQGQISEQRDMVGNDVASTDGYHDAHGTEVAGIIAAVGNNHQGIVGIAPASTVSIYRACWYTNDRRSGARCNSFTLAKAMAAVLDTNTRIVNMSLGGPADPLLGKLLAELLKQGRIVVAALPPDGSMAGFPDNTPGVIVVRSGSATQAPPDVLSAPGDDILTTQPGGGYDFTSGSSMATAHVSGILALMLSVSHGLDAASAEQVLESTSTVVNGMRQVNAAAALHALQQTPHR